MIFKRIYRIPEILFDLWLSYLELEEGEAAEDITQHDIAGAVDVTSAQQVVSKTTLLLLPSGITICYI